MEPMPIYEEYPDYRADVYNQEEIEECELQKQEEEMMSAYRVERARQGYRSERVYPSYQVQDSNFLNNPNY